MQKREGTPVEGLQTYINLTPVLCVDGGRKISVTAILDYVLLARKSCPPGAVILHLQKKRVSELLASERFHVVLPWASTMLPWVSPFMTCNVCRPKKGGGVDLVFWIIDYKSFKF